MRGDLHAAADQHREAIAAFAGLGDPILEGGQLVNLAMALVKLGQWQRGVPELLRAMTLVTESGDVDGMLASMSVAGSLLRAGGDAEGAALSWSMATALSSQRRIPIHELDRDDDEFAAVRRELEPAYADIERRVASTSLDEAVEVTAARLRELHAANPADVLGDKPLAR